MSPTAAVFVHWQRSDGVRRPGASVRPCAALCFLAVLAVAVPSVAAEPVPGGTLVVGAVADPLHLNPAVRFGANSGVPGAQVFAGLVRIDGRFEPQPYLARSWTMSSDGLRYTFHLAPNTRFHEGTPVTSRDVAFSLDTVRKHYPFGMAMLDAVATVGTPEPHTAVIRLTRPHPAIVEHLQSSTGPRPVTTRSGLCAGVVADADSLPTMNRRDS